MAHRIAEKHELVLVVQEEKGLDDFYRGHPDEAAIVGHFARMKETEDRFFGDYSWDSVGAERVVAPRGGLNNSGTARRLSDSASRAAVVFGCGILKPEVIRALPAGRTFNVHQGLSPYYRGSGTNFWPYVEGRPQYIGATIHLIDEYVDTGAIVAHARPAMEKTDTLHSLGCKTVVASADALVAVLEQVESGSVPAVKAQWEKGRLYRRSDMTGAAVDDALKKDEAQFIARFMENSPVPEPAGLIALKG